jgi:hypothetical protein
MYQADIFVVLDDVQYTVRDWRSRNRIKTPNGTMWLTVPVKAQNIRQKTIRDVEVDYTQPWRTRQLKTFEAFCKRSRHFDEVFNMVRDVLEKDHKYLIEIDMDFVARVLEYFSLQKSIRFSSEIPTQGAKDDRILSICTHLDATNYLTGNAARGYLRESIFTESGIQVEWHSYEHPFYNQLWIRNNEFISHLSVVDLLFNHGPDSLDILTGRSTIPVPDSFVIIPANAM